MTRGRKRGLVEGVGINDADYVTNTRVRNPDGTVSSWICPFYNKWKKMLNRCYSKKEVKKRPTYEDCIVCEEWLTFSNFKAWMEVQNWQGMVLDKDLLSDCTTKVYSPNTCAFITTKINSFLLECNKSRGNLMLGVSVNPDGRFRAMCNNPITRKLEHIGLFTDELEAHLAWKARKHLHACTLANTTEGLTEKVKVALTIKYLN